MLWMFLDPEAIGSAKVTVIGKRGPLPRIYHSAEAMISAVSTVDPPKCLAVSSKFPNHLVMRECDLITSSWYQDIYWYRWMYLKSKNKPADPSLQFPSLQFAAGLPWRSGSWHDGSFWWPDSRKQVLEGQAGFESRHHETRVCHMRRAVRLVWYETQWFAQDSSDQKRWQFISNHIKCDHIMWSHFFRPPFMWHIPNESPTAAGHMGASAASRWTLGMGRGATGASLWSHNSDGSPCNLRKWHINNNNTGKIVCKIVNSCLLNSNLM